MLERCYENLWNLIYDIKPPRGAVKIPHATCLDDDYHEL